MKRIIALLLVLCMLLCLCACRKKPDDSATDNSSSEEIESSSSEESSSSSSSDTSEELVDNTPPPVLYRHPLNGYALEQPWSGKVTAVMINNLKYAMPQHGISQADILYEIEVEGDITRCLALFSDLSQVGAIGPVRSARTAFNSVAVSFDAVIAHCGGSNLALKGMYGAYNDTIANWQHIDEAYNSKYFYRDKERLQNNYSWEHTLFTKGESLQQAMVDKGYNKPTDKEFGLQFSENIVLNGEKAEEIVVKFKFGKTTKFTYDTALGKYKMYQHGKDNIDGNTGEVVSFKNVIAIYTKEWYHTDGLLKLYDTIGNGEGYAAINGQIVPILWSREGLRHPFKYTLKDGTPLTLNAGNTYVALVGIKHELSYK